jgi:hypothetical protein
MDKMILRMKKGSWKEELHPRDGRGQFASSSEKISFEEAKEDLRQTLDNLEKISAIEKLEKFAVPMMEVAYSKDTYNRLFKGGYVKTPVKNSKDGSRSIFQTWAQRRWGAKLLHRSRIPDIDRPCCGNQRRQ